MLLRFALIMTTLLARGEATAGVRAPALADAVRLQANAPARAGADNCYGVPGPRSGVGRLAITLASIECD